MMTVIGSEVVPVVIWFSCVWCLASLYSGKFPHPGKFPYPGNFPYPGFLHEVSHVLFQAFHIVENIHILKNVHIMENAHILEIFFNVSYFRTLSKFQYASLIGRRKQIYRPDYNLYVYSLHPWLKFRTKGLIMGCIYHEVSEELTALHS